MMHWCQHCSFKSVSSGEQSSPLSPKTNAWKGSSKDSALCLLLSLPLLWQIVFPRADPGWRSRDLDSLCKKKRFFFVCFCFFTDPSLDQSALVSPNNKKLLSTWIPQIHPPPAQKLSRNQCRPPWEVHHHPASNYVFRWASPSCESEAQPIQPVLQSLGQCHWPSIDTPTEAGLRGFWGSYVNLERRHPNGNRFEEVRVHLGDSERRDLNGEGSGNESSRASPTGWVRRMSA